MKKLILCTAGVMLSFCFGVNTFAATKASIESAVQEPTGAIQVNCSIKEPNVMQEITVMACEYGDETFLNDVIYADQFSADISKENEFSFSFSPANWTDTAKAYIVRVGGTNIDVPASMLIAFYDGKIYKAGDVNGNGVVDEIDASLLLKYISNAKDLRGAQVAAGDINKDSIVDMIDVIGILNASDKN